MSVRVSGGSKVTTRTPTNRASQAEENAGLISNKYSSPLTIANRDADVVALVSSTSIALTNEKHSLATSETAITFTQNFTGDVQVIEITLTGTALTLTFPSGYLADANVNTLALSGTSGDKYIVTILKMGSNYYVEGKNKGQ